MGANFSFDKMLPTVSPEAPGASNPLRQLELFTNGGKIFLRLGVWAAEAKFRFNT